MEIGFVKMHGAGNDFIVVDEWDDVKVPEDAKPAFVEKISDRHLGVGSDGVIFVQKSEEADAMFVFYNPDGSQAEMCGNGIRCFAKYVYEKGYFTEIEMDVETIAGKKTLKVILYNEEVDAVRVNMGAPQILRGDAQVSGDPESMMVDEPVKVNGKTVRITAVGMGNPHAVVFVDDVDKVDIEEDGATIRKLRELFPNGVNVHFIEHTTNNDFKIRTFERGVEAETLACGTGICASAVAAVLNKRAVAEKRVKFHARGGDLGVEFELEGGEIKSVFLVGPAEEVFSGVFDFSA